MQIVTNKISLAELKQMSTKMFDNLVKAVVDIERQVMAVDADMHVDQEQLLLQDGSAQKDLWGINLFPDRYGQDNFIEFDSMINLRPWQGNRSRGVEDETIRKIIAGMVNQLVEA